MRKLVGSMTILVGLAGCVPAKIVASDGPRVTYEWNSTETKLDRVYSLAIDYCDSWNAPPRVVGDTVNGDQHRTTFACVPRPTLPLNKML